MDTLYIELMGVAVILVTVAIELATHKLEHMTEEYQHIHEMVQLVYKELMLLGLISFMLFLIELWSCLSPAIAHNLHTIHLLLFLLSMAYILEAVFILCISEIVVRRWTKCERMSLLEHAKVKLKVAAIEDELALRGAIRRFFSWCLLYEHHNSQRIARCAHAHSAARATRVPSPPPHLPPPPTTTAGTTTPASSSSNRTSSWRSTSRSTCT